MHDIRDLINQSTPWFTSNTLGLPDNCPTRYKLSGELGYRLKRSIDRIENQLPYSTQYLLTQVSAQKGNWSNFPRFHGDIVGRWTLAETHTHAACAQPPIILADLVRDLIQLQNDDGSFGSLAWSDEPLNPEKAYGNGWTIKALAQYALTFKDDAVTKAAHRLGECYLAMAPAWFDSDDGEDITRGYASTISCFYHALDGVMTMHRLTADPRYLDLAREMAKRITPLNEADHSHMYLMIRRGLLALYQQTNDQAGIAELERELDRFNDQWVMETGGIPERLVKPDENWTLQDEACSLFDWNMLTLAMHAETGNDRWLRRAILNLENNIFYNQNYNGGFCSVEIEHGYPQMGKEAPWCCSVFGPYGLIAGAAYLVTRRDKHTLNIHHAVSGTFVFGDQQVEIHRDDEHQQLRIDLTAAPAITTLRIATPHWLAWTDATSPTPTTENIEFREVSIGADRVLSLPYRYRVWPAQPRVAPTWHPAAAVGEEVILFAGPWLLNHRHQPKPNQPPIGLYTQPTAGFMDPPRMEHILGLPSSGEGFLVAFRTDLAPEPITTFRWPDQDERDIFLYPLKERESPAHGNSAIRLLGHEA
ncbi:MAG: glycoside hydrolase family 127 protein [Phycisphaeraceae bacterium]